jgi:hypothetical protein
MHSLATLFRRFSRTPLGGPVTLAEDGVTLGSIAVGQLDASVTVNVQNAPSGAWLDAWIDFNRDGVRQHSTEQICAGLLADGTLPSFCGRRPWIRSSILPRPQQL